MIGVIISGHGHFADGLLSAMKIIAGKQAKVSVVNFPEGATSDDLKMHLKEAAEMLGGAQLVFLTDIAGGSPYNQAVLLQNKLTQSCRVFSGVNMPFLLQVLFDREEGDWNDLENRWLSGNIHTAAFYEKKKEEKIKTGGI